jgi:hypothetical protein
MLGFESSSGNTKSILRISEARSAELILVGQQMLRESGAFLFSSVANLFAMLRESGAFLFQTI